MIKEISKKPLTKIILASAILSPFIPIGLSLTDMFYEVGKTSCRYSYDNPNPESVPGCRFVQTEFADTFVRPIADRVNDPYDPMIVAGLMEIVISIGALGCSIYDFRQRSREQ